MNKLWISAGLEVLEGKDIQKARDALHRLALATRQESGNLTFKVLQQLDNPQKFTLWECWADERALQQHFDTSHTIEYLAQEWTKLIYIERLHLQEEVESEDKA